MNYLIVFVLLTGGKEIIEKELELARDAKPTRAELVAEPFPEYEEGSLIAEDVFFEETGETVQVEFANEESRALFHSEIREQDVRLVVDPKLLEHPEKQIGIVNREVKVHEGDPDEWVLEEGKTETREVVEELIVEPAVYHEVEVCLGHDIKNPRKFDRTARKTGEPMERPDICEKCDEYKRDGVFERCDPDKIGKTRWMRFKHANGLPGQDRKPEGGNAEQWYYHEKFGKCDNHETHRKLVTHEKKSWKVNNPQILKELENDPRCNLIDIQILEGPEERKSIYSDVWKRKLIFSCKDDDKKVYKPGKEATYAEIINTFDDEVEIWGLNGDFDPKVEKNTNFPKVAAALSVVENMAKNDDGDDSSIYRGAPLQCRCDFLGNLDCCKKNEVPDGRCTANESALAVMRDEGRCHYVGSKSGARVFCCFGGKTARIVQEQARNNLKISWGTPDNPACRGLTIEELEEVDLSKMDLQEIEGDLSLDLEEVNRKMQDSIKSEIHKKLNE